MLTEDDIAQLRRLMELREERDTKKTAAKKAEEAYQEAEMELFERLSDGPVSRLNNVDLGPPWGKVSFGARETYYGRVIKGMEDVARDYYAQHGIENVVTEPKFVMARINEEVRTRKEQGQSMPPGIDFYARRGVTVTRQKS